MTLTPCQNALLPLFLCLWESGLCELGELGQEVVLSFGKECEMVGEYSSLDEFLIAESKIYR